jgi:hypothetical protein
VKIAIPLETHYCSVEVRKNGQLIDILVNKIAQISPQ